MELENCSSIHVAPCSFITLPQMPPVFCSGLAQPMHSKCIASTEMVPTNNSMDPVESVFAGTHDVM